METEIKRLMNQYRLTLVSEAAENEPTKLVTDNAAIDELEMELIRLSKEVIAY